MFQVTNHLRNKELIGRKLCSTSAWRWGYWLSIFRWNFSKECIMKIPHTTIQKKLQCFGQQSRKLQDSSHCPSAAHIEEFKLQLTRSTAPSEKTVWNVGLGSGMQTWNRSQRNGHDTSSLKKNNYIGNLYAAQMIFGKCLLYLLRITEYFELEGTFKEHLVQAPCSE